MTLAGTEEDLKDLQWHSVMNKTPIPQTCSLKDTSKCKTDTKKIAQGGRSTSLLMQTNEAKSDNQSKRAAITGNKSSQQHEDQMAIWDEKQQQSESEYQLDQATGNMQ